MKTPGSVATAPPSGNCAGLVIGENLERQHVTWIIARYRHTDPANVVEIIREDLEPRGRKRAD